MKEKIYYYPGFKTGYVILGLLILTAGVFICLNQSIWILSIPCFVFGIILIASMQGAGIDFNSRMLDKYSDFLLFKTHQYFDLSSYKKCTIEYAREFADESSYGDDLAARSGIFESTTSFSTEVKS